MKRFIVVAALGLLAACATPRSGADAACSPGYATQSPIAGDGHDPQSRDGFLVIRAIPNDDVSASISRAIGARLDAINAMPEADRPSYRALLLSTGGAWGAFGSGFLHGLAQSTDLAENKYDLVTGASTGAIIAPFAFLGEAEDFAAASEVYRTLTDDQVLTRRSLPALLRANSLFDNRRMRDFVINQLRDRQLVERIAAESIAHPERILAVIAVNVDTGQTEAFDLTAIARNQAIDIDTRRAQIAERILASAAIPLAFEPVMMNGCMYLDAGLRQQLFMTGELVSAVVSRSGGVVIEEPSPHGGKQFAIGLRGYQPGRIDVQVDMIVNGAARVEARTTRDTVTPYGLRPIALRSLPILMNQSMWASIDRAGQVGRVLGWRLRYKDASEFDQADSGSAFSLSGAVFDPTFMNALSDYAYRKAVEEGEGAWRPVPGSADILSPPQ